MASQETHREDSAISCKRAFADALADQGAGDLVLLAIVADDEGKTNLPGMPGGRGGSLRALSHVNMRAESDDRSIALLLFGAGHIEDNLFDKWLQPARRSGAMVLADQRFPGIQQAGDAATIWAACVAMTLWDTQWRIETKFPNVFQFSAFAASVETWNRLSCSDEGKIVNAGLEESTRGKSWSKKETPTKRSGTRADIDVAIREYKAKRASTYNDLVEGVKRGGAGAKKSARELFGRNAVVRALGVRSAAMVSKSPAWQAIADELRLRETTRSSSVRQTQRVGLQIAIEDQAQATCAPILEQAQKAVNDYDGRVNTGWAKMLKQMDAKREQRTNRVSSRTSHGDPPEQEESQELRPFSGGEMAYFQDRVEFCGADICSGLRCHTRRKILDLLRKQKSGRFVGYSGEQLAEEVDFQGGQGAVAGAIRDLRDDIVDALREANINCGRFEVVLSGEHGYRFADCVSVRDGDLPETAEITDIGNETDVRNVRDDVLLDVHNVRDDPAGSRRAWILEQLAEGNELQAPAVAKQFKCHVKTSQRDLTALRDEGKVEYVGAPRTGYYRLCQPKNDE